MNDNRTTRELLTASLAAVPPRPTTTRNPATGSPWQPGEYEAALALIRSEAATMQGTSYLPEDAGRDPVSGLWNNAPRGR